MQYGGVANLPLKHPVPQPIPKRFITSAPKSQIRLRRVRAPNPEVTMTRASPSTIEFSTPLSLLQRAGEHWWLEGEGHRVRKRLEPSRP